MNKVKLSTFVQKSKIHHTEIKRAVQNLEMSGKNRKYRDIHKSVGIDGKTMFVTYQWQDEGDLTIIFVKNAKWTKKKRKR